MPNDYDFELSPDLDPETAAELRRLRRQQEVANAMYQRGMQPLQGQMVGGVYVRPSITQGLANMAHSYMAGREYEDIDKKYQSLGEKRAADEKSAWGRVMEAMQGTPERRMPADPREFDQMGEGTPQPADTTIPAVAGSMEKAAQAGMESPYTRKAAQAITMEILKQKRKEVAPFTLGPGQIRYGPDGKQIASAPSKPENQPTSIDEYKFAVTQGYGGTFQQWVKDKAQAIHVNTGGDRPYFHYVAGPNGIVKLDARGREAPSLVQIDGKTVQKAEYDPTLQGAIAGAKETGQAKAKRALNMAGLGETIQTAEDLLSGKSGNALPTGSSVGTAVDWLAGLVGASPEGSEEAQILKSVGGALTSKMPRMEGPQSDKDTMLYKEMAAVVGDSTIPRGRRLAALEIVKELWGKYEDKQPVPGSASPTNANNASRTLPPPPPGFTLNK